MVYLGILDLSQNERSTTMAEATKLILPKTGMARVKSVLSGDSVILLGKPLAPNQAPPEVIFTFDGVSAPR